MSEISTQPNPSSLSFPDGDTKPWENVSSLLKYGEQARAQNDSSRAFAFYVRATELDPNRVEAWVGRAATAPTLDDSITSWAYALSLSPAYDEAKNALQQQVDDKIASSTVQDANGLLNLGRILAEAGQPDLAFQLLKRATELDDTNEEAWVWRAGVAQDTAEIISCLNQALALNPSNSQAQAGLQWTMSHQPQMPEPASRDDAAEAARLVDQAQQLLENQDREGAHRLFEQATDLDPLNEKAWLWRGSTTTDVDEALTCMEQALVIDPQNESAREARSWLRVKKLRDGVKTRPPQDQSQPWTTDSNAQPKRSLASLLFLLVTPIVVIVLGLAVLIWKLL